MPAKRVKAVVNESEMRMKRKGAGPTTFCIYAEVEVAGTDRRGEEDERREEQRKNKKAPLTRDARQMSPGIDEIN